VQAVCRKRKVHALPCPFKGYPLIGTGSHSVARFSSLNSFFYKQKAPMGLDNDEVSSVLLL